MVEPLVSICCTTYNHEKYVRDAIEGFLMQNCDFDYEIIIHDDASTDNTREVIEEYSGKFPDKFVTIYTNLTLSTRNNFMQIQEFGVYPNYILSIVHVVSLINCQGVL